MDFITRLFSVGNTPIERDEDYNKNFEEYLKKREEINQQEQERIFYDEMLYMIERGNMRKRIQTEEIRQDFEAELRKSNSNSEEPDVSPIKVACILGVVIASTGIIISKL